MAEKTLERIAKRWRMKEKEKEGMTEREEGQKEGKEEGREREVVEGGWRGQHRQAKGENEDENDRLRLLCMKKKEDMQK